MRNIKAFVVAFVTLLILDFLWLGVIAKDFNLQQLSEIGRIENGEFDVFYPAALAAYVLMALGIVMFALPRVSNRLATVSAATWGALLGLVVYGVYESTNLSVLKNYPFTFAVADVLWGTFAFAVTNVVTSKFAK